MKIGTIGYVPPAGVGFPDAFLRNLRAYKTEAPIHLYSDAPELYGITHKIPNPGQAVLYRNAPLSINNYVFIQGIELALREGLDFYLYLETDVRVRGDCWDGVLFDEFFKHDGAVAGGTPSIWNIGMCGAEAAIAALQFSSKVIKKTGRPPLVWSGAGRYGGPIGMYTYPNGAGAVFHTATLAAIFKGYQSDIGAFCANCSAWDVHIGKGLWNEFGVGVFDRLAVLKSEYSGYRDCHYSYTDRIKMLMDGAVVLVHQVKSDFVP